MLKCTSRTGLVLTVAAWLAASGSPTVMAQSLNSLNDVYIGGFEGPENGTGPWPVVAGASTGTNFAAVAAGNGSAAVGVGAVNSAGHFHAYGLSTPLPQTNSVTSLLPKQCVMYPGVDASINC